MIRVSLRARCAQDANEPAATGTVDWRYQANLGGSARAMIREKRSAPYGRRTKN